MRSNTRSSRKKTFIALATALLCAGAQAQVSTPIKIGVLTGLRSRYSDRVGAGCS